MREQDPLVGRLRKQLSEKKLDRKHFTMEDEILKKKTVINDILYTPTVVPDVLKDCLLILAHDKQGHKQIQKNLQFTQTVVPLERYDKAYPKTL